MHGLNKTITISQFTRAVTDSGSATETEVTILTGVSAAWQPHLLNNLPPPAERYWPAGEQYLREFRCWIPFAALGGIVPLVSWFITDEDTNEKWRIKAVIDDAGRKHHWLLRMENYSPAAVDALE